MLRFLLRLLCLRLRLLPPRLLFLPPPPRLWVRGIYSLSLLSPPAQKR